MMLSIKGLEVVHLMLALFLTIYCSSVVCDGDICEEHVLLNGNLQRAFGCPRLDDHDNDSHCCGNLNSKYCCDNITLSIYRNQTGVSATNESLGSIIGKIIVLTYGLVVVLIVATDAISHFYIKKKKERIE